MEAFFDLLFDDDAPHALARYQRDFIGDRELEFSSWKKAESIKGATAVLERSIRYVHPVKNAVGPSEAKTSRHQRLLRFGNHGILLENTTEVLGIPMSD